MLRGEIFENRNKEEKKTVYRGFYFGKGRA
jgi:hypothetical protein